MALISLPKWIQKARCSVPKEGYVECALSVAYELTSHLCFVVGTAHDDDAGSSNERSEEKKGGDLSASCVQIEDIAAENVVVTIADSGIAVIADHLVAKDASVRPSEAKPSDIFDAPQLVERDVCCALGNILFELFSQGDPPLVVDLGASDDENDVSFSDLLLGVGAALEGDDASLPAAKKKPSARSSSKSAQAKLHLQEQGLPQSICRLVHDLLEAEAGNQYVSNTALLSLGEAQFDLMQMRLYPQRFLNDRTCPRDARKLTNLFNQGDGEMHGREREMKALMEKTARVYYHYPRPSHVGAVQQQQNPTGGFLCEAVFLSGHSGSGKSRIVKEVASFCNSNDWFVLSCKFDRQVPPLITLMHSIDGFFARFLPVQDAASGSLPQRHPSVQEAFGRISRSIISSTDDESFGQLCGLFPNLSCIQMRTLQHASFSEASGVLGSGSNRLKFFFSVIFNALFAGGHPVAMMLEDLQWIDPFSLDIVCDTIKTISCSSYLSTDGRFRGGLLLLGNYRDNEVGDGGFLMEGMASLEQAIGNIYVSRMAVRELAEDEINKMLSYKLCLPIRHTRELAQLVHQKTRGSPLYLIEFLRSLVQNDLLTFSVKARRWTWDDTPIDMQMLSDGVVELLMRKLKQLSHEVVEALKVASCFGQLNTSTIHLLDLGQFVPHRMLEALESAVAEGILDRAGPIFAFSHDLLKESAYNLIPADERYKLHRKIGMSLAQDPKVSDDAELCALAVDQINICKNADGILDPVQRAMFARLNLAAGKHSISAASYEQARGYFEAGISLLHTDPWTRQYELCLELHEKSVVVSFMDGKELETVQSRLDAILSNAQSFSDTLNSRALLAKVLASQEHHTRAVQEMMCVLSKLGEEFPAEVDLAMVTMKMNSTLPLLDGLSKEKLLSLPVMTDPDKLNAMRFLGLLTSFAHFIPQHLSLILSARMIELTFQVGFCDESIAGLAIFCHGLILYSDEIELARKLVTITDIFIKGNANEHSLRARLTPMIITVKAVVEPFQSTADYAFTTYNSAGITVADSDNGMYAIMLCVSVFFGYADHLPEMARTIGNCLSQMTRHKRKGVLHGAMSSFNTCTALIGGDGNNLSKFLFDVKTSKELYQMADEGHNTFLMNQVATNMMCLHMYLREHIVVTDLAEKLRMRNPGKEGARRGVLDFFRIFFEGISALSLARDTKEEKWRKIGERAIKSMVRFVECSAWNYENKLNLMQAELYYLDGRHSMAELSYQSAIVSAREHKFYHEEALARELFGVCLIETNNVEKGLEQLSLALDGYKRWGATRKCEDVKDFIDSVKIGCRGVDVATARSEIGTSGRREWTIE